MLPAGPASFVAPGPDLVQLALRADERHSSREAILGIVLAALMLLAVGQGWLWPVLACGVVFGVAGFRQGPTPPVTVRARPLLGDDRGLR